MYSLCADVFTNGKVNSGSIRVDHNLCDVLESVKNKKWFICRISSIQDIDDLPVVIRDTIKELGHTSDINCRTIEGNPELIMNEIDAVGWDHFVGVSDDLRTVRLCIRGGGKWSHEVELHIPENYPESAPTISLAAPFVVTVDWTKHRNMRNVVAAVEKDLLAHEAYFQVPLPPARVLPLSYTHRHTYMHMDRQMPICIQYTYISLSLPRWGHSLRLPSALGSDACGHR